MGAGTVVDAEAVAEARRTLGRLLASHRRAAGYNQYQLASRIGYRRSTVANVETGRQQTVRVFWERCDQLLDADGALARGHDGLEALAREQHRARAIEEAPTKRRDVTKLLALLPAADAGLMFSAVERLGLQTERVDQKLVAGHAEVAENLAGLYRGGDPRTALPMAVNYAESLLELLDASMGDRERSELAAIAVGVHCQVGLWACHMHKPAVAYRHLATACDLAASTRDPALHARALGAFSYLFSSAPRGGTGGQPRRALALLDAALTRAERSDDFTKGWLATWRADQHATLGNLRAAAADIELAGYKLTATEPALHSGFFSRRNYGYGMTEHLRSVRGVVLALHKQADEADHTFNQVLMAAANMRRRIATYGHIGMVQAATHHPEAACDALRRAATLAVRERYAMGLARAVGVRHRFPTRWAGQPCVRDLDDQLAALAVT
ncbi:MAG: helix-turn-helix domain-containing protein [Micromonosporaceae bacterium]|nr:helix-turn-helix domain-containing protein [Micromonosporaceae bacterium]